MDTTSSEEHNLKSLNSTWKTIPPDKKSKNAIKNENFSLPVKISRYSLVA